VDDRDVHALHAPLRLPLGAFVLNLSGQQLETSDRRRVDLRPQAYAVLRQLATHPGRLVTKEELLAAVWPNVVVTDDSLVQAVADIRRALGPDGQRLIRTVPRRGYTLVADIVAPAQPPEGGTIAVLPFDDVGRDGARGWLGDGLCISITSALARLTNLTVLSPLSGPSTRCRPERAAASVAFPFFFDVAAATAN
jgi:DNA-binding winged helix-turn-helix (wHTH) protein